MSGREENAGLQPAFMEYRRIGERYERLVDQFRANRQVHAYLFAGPRGIGKKTFARYLASALFCPNDPKPCGGCGQCRLIRDGRHSSVTEIVAEPGKVIPVDRVRELVSLVSMHSLDGRERIIIIEPAESLTPQAQNTLLKSLEDPNINVVYFLLSHDISSLLDTILSRCFVFKLTPWPDELLTEHLLRLGYSREAAANAAALAGGNVGEALAALDGSADDAREAALRQILNVHSARDAVRCCSAAKDMAGGADQLLFLLERYLQQCMMVKSGLLTEDILRDTPWEKYIHSASMSDLMDLTEQIFKTRKRKMSNVNWQSNVDQLTFRLLEATSKW